MELEAGDILITDVTRDEDLRTVAEDGSEATIFRPNFKVLRMVDPE
jgi:hypothetical protein